MLLWITGSKGQLGSSLAEICKGKIDTIQTGREVDIGNPKEITEFVKKHSGITHIVNCAAFSEVDKAEKLREEAYQTNARGPQNLGEIAKDVGAKFIHISTDYVFPGTGEQPLTEKDQTGPLSYYGVTKLEGENRALDLGALVIRTSWVFGGKGKNFVSKLLIMLQTHEEVYLTDDQWGRFTYAFDLAKTILKVLNKNGLYQFANGGVATRYEFGIRMREEALLLGYPVLTESLIPVPGATFKAPTARPRYSAFDTTKIESLIQIRHWQDTIKDFLCAQIAACS